MIVILAAILVVMVRNTDMRDCRLVIVVFGAFGAAIWLSSNRSRSRGWIQGWFSAGC